MAQLKETIRKDYSERMLKVLRHIERHLDEQISPGGEIDMQTIGGSTYAVTTHFGAYEHLSKTYPRLCGQ